LTDCETPREDDDEKNCLKQQQQSITITITINQKGVKKFVEEYY